MAQPASPEVVAVGAGMAGLICAYRLAAAWPPAVLVLDTADPAGGRVLSHRHQGAEVNLGAQFLAGPGPLWDVAPARSVISCTDQEVTGAFLGDLMAEWPDLDCHVAYTVVHRWPAAVPYWAPGGRLGHEVLRQPFGWIRFAGDYLSYLSMQVAAMSG